MTAIDSTLLEKYRQLLHTYADSDPAATRFRPASWAGQDDTDYALLRNEELTAPFTGSYRQVHADTLRTLGAALDLDDAAAVRRFFVLVMAWGTGTSAPRSYRYTRLSLHDDRFDTAVREALTLCRSDDTAALSAAYKRFHRAVHGLGPSFFTKLLCFGGRVDGRAWQPLILDDRVFRSLNTTLGLSTRVLAGSRYRADRYRAYVEHLHAVADALTPAPGTTPVTAERLEWVLFRHNGADVTAGPQSRPN